MKIREEVKNSNISAYLRIRPILEKGEMPPDKGKAYSLPACKDYIENHRNKLACAEAKADDTKAADDNVADAKSEEE